VLGSEIKHLNNKRNNTLVTAATFLTLAAAITLVIAGTTTAVIIAPLSVQSAEAALRAGILTGFEGAAPVVVCGDNIYIAWWTTTQKMAMKK
jgi:hypothetical protein